MSNEIQTAELPAINPAILPLVPETLLIASEEKLWKGMERIVKMYGRNLPQGVDAGTAILLMLAAKEYGLNPLEAISNLFFIGGRIVPSANTMLRLATGNGLSIRPLVESDELWEAEFSRPGRESIVQSYTIQMAQKAGLTGGPTWKKHPMYMLRARCISAGIRLYAGDLVKGIEYNAEELTNGTGYFDPNGNFTPDPKIVGTEPEAKDFKLFEGRTSEQKEEAPAKATKAKTSQQRAKVDATAAVAEAAGVEPTKPAQAAETAQEEPQTAPLTQKVGMLPAGKLIAWAHDSNNVVDFDGTVKNIFAMLVKAEGGNKDAAKAKAAELMKECGASAAVEMKGKPSFLKFYLLADDYCVERLSAPKAEAAPAEVPAFDPHRGARTASSGTEVADANPTEIADLDARILDLYAELAQMNLADEATKVTEDTGYADESEASPAGIKLQTIKALESLKLNTIKQAS